MLPPAAQGLGFTTAELVLDCTGPGDDRAGVFTLPDGVLIVVADGAGGMAGGAAAAETIVRGVREAAAALGRGEVDPADLLLELDRKAQVAGGQSTAVIAIVRSDGVFGASVGDSGAIRCENGNADDLTRGQQRKPLIGSGSAVPVPFREPALRGTLLVATDGLLKYANRAQLVRTLGHQQLNEIPVRLASLARLPSGALQDDIGLVVCRPR